MRKLKYRVAAEDEEQPKEESAKSPKELIQSIMADNSALLSTAFVLGVAAVFVQAGITDRKQMANLKAADVVSNLRTVLLSVAQDRSSIKQKLTKLWRLGPSRYLQQEARAFAGLAKAK